MQNILERRRTFTLGLAAAIAGCTASVTARSVRDTLADTDLIEACCQLVALQASLTALLANRRTLEDEDRTYEHEECIGREIGKMQRLVQDLMPARSMAGMVAMSRASLASAMRDREGDLCQDYDFAELIAFNIAANLATIQQT